MMMILKFTPGVIVLGILVVFGVKTLDRKFACPNCGHHFERTMLNTLFSEMETFLHPKRNYLKCPRCKVRDECSALDDR